MCVINELAASDAIHWNIIHWENIGIIFSSFEIGWVLTLDLASKQKLIRMCQGLSKEEAKLTPLYI